MHKKIMAVIPARGGSVGIPGKNIIPIAGSPLITYTINAALQSAYINRIIVSTDNNNIARISQNAGTEVVRRPEAISGDNSKSEDAILHVLDVLHNKENYQPDIIVFLQCTSPLMTGDDIDGTIEALINKNADSALAVTDFHYFLWRKNNDESMEGLNHDKNIRELRQNKKKDYLETGSIYVMRCQGFIEKKHRFFGNTVSYFMPKERCLEIDDPVDLKIAEVLIRDAKSKYRIALLPKNIEAVIFDFDGVFTDNSVIIKQNGDESVICNRGDGMGISIIRNLGIPVLVLSSENSPVVEARCNKLKIEYRQGLQKKEKTMVDWLNEKHYSLENIIYVGNDINDIECLKIVGCSVVVNDAMPYVKQYAEIVLTNKGGHGAIRELADMIYNMKEGN